MAMRFAGWTSKALGVLLAASVACTALPVAAQTPGAASTPSPQSSPQSSPLPSPVAGPAAGSGSSQAPRPSDYIIAQCNNATREEIREQVQNAALAEVSDGMSAVDTEAIVNRQWAQLGMDEVLSAEVARAVANVEGTRNVLEVFLSGWSPAKAEEFATIVATDAFSNTRVSAAMAQLSAAVGKEIAAQVDAQLTRSASAAFLCLREYVGENYSSNLFSAFETTTAQVIAGTQIADVGAEISVSPGSVHGYGLTGAGILIATQIARRLAVRISEQLAERVTGRIVLRVIGRAGVSVLPIVGWVVGVGLLAWDIYQGFHGALPQIQQALTGEEVMQKVRSEIVDAVNSSLPTEISFAALETSVQMMDTWSAFCDRYAGVCTLAAENPAFRSILDNAPVSGVAHIAALKGVFDQQMGAASLNRAIESGDFDTLLYAPAASLLVSPGGALTTTVEDLSSFAPAQILSDTRSVETTKAWIDLAGDDLSEVAMLGLQRYVEPEEITQDQVATLVALNDGVAARKLLSLEPASRDRLWEVPLDSLRLILDGNSTEYLNELGAAMAAPWVAATPAANVVDGLLSGYVTLADLQATPAPTPPLSGTAPALADGAVTSPTASESSSPTPAQTEAAAPSGQNAGGEVDSSGVDGWSLALLVGMAIVLMIAAGFVWLRRPRR